MYREEVSPYPGMQPLIRDLIEAPGIRVGLVTRHISHDPVITLARLFARHDLDGLDFLHCLPLREGKAPCYKAAREQFDINPARACAVGDEHRDYEVALSAGIHPFIVSYGFESRARLTQKFVIPGEVISPDAETLCSRVRHALELPRACRGSISAAAGTAPGKCPHRPGSRSAPAR